MFLRANSLRPLGHTSKTLLSRQPLRGRISRSPRCLTSFANLGSRSSSAKLRPKPVATRSIAMGPVLSTGATPTSRVRYSKISANSAAVLIVENEVLIRMNAVQMVEDAGYVALEASNADEAIAILKRRQDVGAVFTDINMSGSICGLKLAHAIRLRWPPIHLILTSGLPAEMELPPGAHFVRKPYENARVIALLHELFDGT